MLKNDSQYHIKRKGDTHKYSISRDKSQGLIRNNAYKCSSYWIPKEKKGRKKALPHCSNYVTSDSSDSAASDSHIPHLFDDTLIKNPSTG